MLVFLGATTVVPGRTYDNFFFKMDGEKFSIDRLEGGSNWLTWKFQMKQYLEAGDLWDVVDGTEVAPAVNTTNYATLIVAWKKTDAKARRAISGACHKQPLLQIMNCETACGMWKTLKSTYEQASKSNILFLQQRYYSFVKDPCDDIATFLSKLMEIVQQMKDQNECVSDSMVMTKILMSLPAEFNHFHSAWESTSADGQTMGNLRARLMAEELRLKSQGQVERVEALVVKKNFSKKPFLQGVMLGIESKKTAIKMRISKAHVFGAVEEVTGRETVLARKINLG